MHTNGVFEVLKRFVVDLLKHEIIFFILVLLGIISIFIWRRYLVYLLHFPYNMLRCLKEKLVSLHNKFTVAAIKKKHSEYQRIKKDITTHVDQLKTDDDETKFTAVQYLLEYPSPEGFSAIIKLAVNLEDKNSRDKLICALCESARSYDDWYK